MKTTITARLEELGVFPIIVIDDPADALPLGRTLLEGGLPCAEVTFRTAAAGEAIRRLRDSYPAMLLGAGTVLKVEQAREAIAAGARFILAPGFNPAVVDFCLEAGISVYPGICTPTEVEAALNKGLSVLKFFPAEPMGGLSYLKAMAGPFPMVRYLPTGGINLSNLPDYLRFEKVVGCAGTWMVTKQWLAEKNWVRIRAEVTGAVEAVRRVRQGGNDD